MALTAACEQLQIEAISTCVHPQSCISLMINFQSMSAAYHLGNISASTLAIIEKHMLARMRSEFGQRLFDARTKAEKTQQQVAAACGMGQSNYAKLERKANGSVNTPALAAFLGVNVQWLAYGVGPVEPGKDQPATLSPSAQNLGEWLDRIKDPDRHYRIAHAAMAVILEELDGPPKPPTPTQPPAKERRRAGSPGR